MQRLISVKNASDLPEVFKGKVTFQVVDNNVEAVVFTEGDESIRIVNNGTYSNHLKILTQQPKKTSHQIQTQWCCWRSYDAT